METPSFTFRLERVRDLRERGEGAARRELARELQLRIRGEALSMAATRAVTGPGPVERLGGVPAYAETQEYVRHVRANAAKYRTAGSTATASALSASPSDHGIV